MFGKTSQYLKRSHPYFDCLFAWFFCCSFFFFSSHNFFLVPYFLFTPQGIVTNLVTIISSGLVCLWQFAATEQNFLELKWRCQSLILLNYLIFLLTFNRQPLLVSSLWMCFRVHSPRYGLCVSGSISLGMACVSGSISLGMASVFQGLFPWVWPVCFMVHFPRYGLHVSGAIPLGMTCMFQGPFP